MKALVFGSLNIDKVYSMPKLPMQGETLFCADYQVHVGGKGLNQAVSLHRAGFQVTMAGSVGADGDLLVDYLRTAGVNTVVNRTEGYTGHAVILVDGNGQNQMVLYPGANREIPQSYCDEVLQGFGKGDLILLQYETAQVSYMIHKAHEKGMVVAWNPSPFVPEIADMDFSEIDFLILNEYEGQCIAKEDDCAKVPEKLLQKMQGGAVVLTLGGDGAVFADGKECVRVPAFSVEAVDTTCAGDTFTGYFLQSYLNGATAKTALRTAGAASAIVVTQTGAAETIPEPETVQAFLACH